MNGYDLFSSYKPIEIVFIDVVMSLTIYDELLDEEWFPYLFFFPKSSATGKTRKENVRAIWNTPKKNSDLSTLMSNIPKIEIPYKINFLLFRSSNFERWKLVWKSYPRGHYKYYKIFAIENKLLNLGW